jgi:putative oxidoreductase
MAKPGDRTRLIIPPLGYIYRALEALTWPLIRFAAGLFLVPHGAQKLFGWFDGRGLEATSASFARMGFGSLVGAVEFVGGILIALGLLTRPAAMAATILLAVAVAVHLPNGFFVTKGGFEYAMLWAVLCASIAVRGGGRLSLDRALGREF